MSVVRRFSSLPGLRKGAAGLFSVLVFALALWVLHRTVGRFNAAEVLATARAHPAGILVASLLCTLGSYIALSGFDVLGLKHVGRPVPTGWAMLISFVSHAVSHNAGFAVLTGGSVRLRMYSTFGLGMGEVAGVMAFAGLSFALGVAALASVAFIAEGDRLAPLLRLPTEAMTALGWLLAILLLIYFIWSLVARRPLAVGVWRLVTPSLRLAFGQIAVAALDLALVAGSLYLLLPKEAGIGYGAFIGLYVVATVAGTLSHVPGGLGVFEGALVLLLPNAPTQGILAALLIFRVFYNLLPLVLAALILAVFELVQRRRHLSEPAWISDLGPGLGAMLVFGGGTVLLLAGAVSASANIPKMLAEPAHLLSGGAAAVLLTGSWGLLKGEDRAYRIVLPALAVSALLALMRGPDWIVAGLLTGIGGVIAAAGPLFHRQPIPTEPTPLGWLGASAAVVMGAVWLSWHADHTAWHLLSFANDEGSRSMRANLTALAALAAAAFAIKAPWATGGRGSRGRPPSPSTPMP